MINIPNLLSFFRIIIIPFFSYTFLNSTESADYYLAAGILALSGLTDMLDGYIARHFNMVTKFGKILDPIADKLTLFAVCICLWVKIPELRLAYLFFMVKEVIMIVGSLFLIKRSVVLDGARWFGKLYTVIFYAVMLIIIVFNDINTKYQAILVCFMAIFTVMSLCMYIPVFFSLKNSNQPKQKNTNNTQ